MADIKFVTDKYKVVLASKSPRRQALLKEIVPEFSIMLRDTAETYPPTLVGGQIVEHLAKLKASAFDGELADNQLLITADTIVWIDNMVLGKPKDRSEAIDMFSQECVSKQLIKPKCSTWLPMSFSASLTIAR